MQAETLPVEFEITMTVDPELAEGAVAQIMSGFSPIYAEIKAWREESAKLMTVDPSDKAALAQAKKLRLEGVKIRTTGEKVHKGMKQDALIFGRAVDGQLNTIKALTQPEERRLKELEETAERIEAERISKLASERTAQLAAFDKATPSDVGLLSPEAFAVLLEEARDLFEYRAAKRAKEEAASAEEARIIAEAKAKREAEEAAERERIRLENERLKAEAEAREEVLRVEREKADAERRAFEDAARKQQEAAAEAARVAKMESDRLAAEAAEKTRKERESREKAEWEAKALRDAEERRKADEAARLKAESEAKALAEKKAAQAPDREKIRSVASILRNMAVPEVKSINGKILADSVADRIAELATWIEAQIEKL